MNSTIRDVARQAGVSISTVSRVLNDSSPVSDEKKRLVLEAAERLSYEPNPAARSLHSKQTGGIGVLLPFVSGEFFSELLSGMDEAAQELGLFLLVSTSHRRPSEFRRAARTLNTRVDGLIVMAPEIDAAGAASILGTDAPVVFLNTQADQELSADVLNFDNCAGSAALTQHLLDAGHTRIALVRGPQEAWDARERTRGYRSAMAAAGVATDALEVEGGFTREAGYEAALAVLALEPRPTAVVASNDYCALGVMSALHESGVVVPDEVAVCGFDGLPSSRYAVPALTTARVPIRDIGARAVHRLAARLARGSGVRECEHEVAAVELQIRESTGGGPS